MKADMTHKQRAEQIVRDWCGDVKNNPSLVLHILRALLAQQAEHEAELALLRREIAQLMRPRTPKQNDPDFIASIDG